jgi:hypothetical protein
MTWNDLARSLGLSHGATSTHILDEICKRLSETTGKPTAPVAASGVHDDPQAAFHVLAERTAEVLGISLADAYSRVSQEAPTLYERASMKARLN